MPASQAQTPATDPAEPLDHDQLKAQLRAYALDVGFDVVGFGPPVIPAANQERYHNFVAQGHHGTMSWIEDRLDQRAEPTRLWDQVKSVMVVGQNYAPTDDPRTEAFARLDEPQLANMVMVGHLAEEWKADGVTVNAVYPGVCGTNIKRHMGVDRSFLGWYVSNPLLWFFTKTAKQGAQTPLYTLIDEDMNGVTGKLLSNLKTLEVDDKAKDLVLRKKLVAVDKYWSGIVQSKEELVSQK